MGIVDSITSIIQPVARAIGVDENDAGQAIGYMIPGLGEQLGAKEANEANASEAAKNRAFQERMSSTAHQREVEDLTKAGLNPILSAQQGASTPGGSMAVMENVAKGASASAQSALRYMTDLKKQAKEIELMDSQKELQRAQKNNVDMDTRVKQKGAVVGDLVNMLAGKALSTAKGISNLKTRSEKLNDKGYKSVYKSEQEKWQQTKKQLP